MLTWDGFPNSVSRQSWVRFSGKQDSSCQHKSIRDCSLLRIDGVPAPEWTFLHWYHRQRFSDTIIWTTKRQKQTLWTCGCWPFEVSISCHATWESVINRPRSPVLPVAPITRGWEMCSASHYDSNICVHTVCVDISKTLGSHRTRAEASTSRHVVSLRRRLICESGS